MPLDTLDTVHKLSQVMGLENASGRVQGGQGTIDPLELRLPLGATRDSRYRHRWGQGVSGPRSLLGVRKQTVHGWQA